MIKNFENFINESKLISGVGKKYKLEPSPGKFQQIDFSTVLGDLIGECEHYNFELAYALSDEDATLLLDKSKKESNCFGFYAGENGDDVEHIEVEYFVCNLEWSMDGKKMDDEYLIAHTVDGREIPVTLDYCPYFTFFEINNILVNYYFDSLYEK